MGIAGDVALDWTLDKTPRPAGGGRSGLYAASNMNSIPAPRAQMDTGMDAAYRFRHDKASLAARGPEGVVRAAFMFSLPTLVQSLGEMGLQGMGVQRRFNLDTLDRQGDETGHDGAKAIAYLAVIGPERRRNMPDPESDGQSGWQPGGDRGVPGLVPRPWCRRSGGLPTVFNDQPIPDAAIARIERLFIARHGAEFLVLPSRSQYPRADFYDSGYHLRQSAQ